MREEHQLPPGVTPEMLVAEIELRARQIFQERREANRAGTAVDDWLAAEEEVLRHHGLS